MSKLTGNDKLMAEAARERLRLDFNQQMKQTIITDKAPIAGDDTTRDRQVHDISIPEWKKNFDEKIYWFPESYNQLRKEIYENWPNLWEIVGYRMAYDAVGFIECMNEALDLNIMLDSEQVGFISQTYLDKLRKLRGLKS